MAEPQVNMAKLADHLREPQGNMGKLADHFAPTTANRSLPEQIQALESQRRQEIARKLDAVARLIDEIAMLAEARML